MNLYAALCEVFHNCVLYSWPSVRPLQYYLIWKVMHRHPRVSISLQNCPNHATETIGFQKERERAKKAAAASAARLFLGGTSCKLVDGQWREDNVWADKTLRKESDSPVTIWKVCVTVTFTTSARWILWAAFWMWWWGQAQQDTPGFPLIE